MFKKMFISKINLLFLCRSQITRENNIMSKVIKLKKGLDIKLKGKAEKILFTADSSDNYAVMPPDFLGVTPKLLVKPGDKVKAGSPLFFDKNNPEVFFTSPVSGTVEAVNRGERRRILEVVVKADKEISYLQFNKAEPSDLSREEIVDNLQKSGLWPFIIQRPYAVIANPADTPKAIFISCFDSAPLAPDYDFVLNGQEDNFQRGIEVMKKLTSGKIHLGVNAKFPVANVFAKAKGVVINSFKGPHPAGNAGVQMHHVDPVNKGDIVWQVNPQDIAIIGKLFESGTYDASKIVAITGSEIKNPKYARTLIGASLTSLIKDNVNEGNNRYISGNALTGTGISKNGFLGYYHSQITVIPEGDFYEMFGWALPGLKKFSFSRTFLTWLMPNKEYDVNTNLHGGIRSFVVSEEYEKVLPMDILPVHLLKAVLIEDIDKMEQLGIYEIAEEDLALCEFVCTSKIDIQEILRTGLDLMRKEMS